MFTVTNDLSFDRRMHRICESLANAGYKVTLVGVWKKNSARFSPPTYAARQMNVWKQKGALFYAEYNFRLFWYLLFKKTDCICSIDLDTILAGYFASVIRRKKRVYDAHEYFTEQKEVVTRPGVYKVWNAIAKFCIPKFRHGYTVSGSIVKAFKENYNVDYSLIRNLPKANAEKVSVDNETSAEGRPFLIYTGAVNEARGFEALIPAMQKLHLPLEVYGDGNFKKEALALAGHYNVLDKIKFHGMVSPAVLERETPRAFAGINLVENTGLNQYYSLANKFFDYIMQGVPQITMNFPEYKYINDKYEVAVLIDELTPACVASAVNRLADNAGYYERLKSNCALAAKELNWENEDRKLTLFYQDLFE